MTHAQNLRHRRAVAAAQRRAPVPEPQLGFDPTAVYGGPTHTKGRGKFTDFFPPFFPTGTSTDDDSQTSTASQPSTDATSATSTSSSDPLPTTTSAVVPTTTTPPPPPPTTTSAVITTLPTTTAVVTVSVSRTSSSTTTSASATATSEPSTGMSTGAVVGGIGAGIVAIAAIGFAIAFFIRRSRKRGNFDTHDFRRSAVLLDDPPTHDDTVSRGFNPRPPTMIERHLASPAPTFGIQYGNPGPAYNEYNGEYADNGAGYGASNYQSFAPGQVFNVNNGAPSPISPNSAHPMYPNAGYGQSPFSPAAPQGQYPGQEYYENGQPCAGVAAYPVLTRQGSRSSQTSEHTRLPTPTDIQRESAPANDYVDLNRSSVSPYQAEQYQEISRRLNTEVPAGLATAQIEKDLPAQPNTASPFADPSSAPPSPGGQYAIDRRNLERPVSGESLASQTLDFPVPPSPAHTVSSRYRVDSTPPTLPEIFVESRVSVGGFPMARNSELMSPGLTTGQGSRFPTTPSPLASSFAMPSPPPAGESSFPNHGAAAAPSPLHNGVTAPEAAAAPQQENSNVKQRAYSMYDPEDAYGGI
ncbi:hypothetical protein M413DRAFT_24892 [Hebeloma cylindrosporum]|uniref:Uncharacterized protein n=1 Tax=Hebeloma cylindrosporum TaxID=76867 RepID=A0A0C3CKS1_HEBCY|nr:hypothetical protein M413DRAFT_24892 [Hebeloma cylindrosporum h7]